jgi:hypothetical protein
MPTGAHGEPAETYAGRRLCVHPQADVTAVAAIPEA